MADRSSLHVSKIVPFSVWLRKCGWTIVPCKGDYEIFRAEHEQFDTLIVHARASTAAHVSLHGQSDREFWKWKSQRRRFKDSPVRMNSEDEHCKECKNYCSGAGLGRCKSCRCYDKWDGLYDRELIKIARVED